MKRIIELSEKYSNVPMDLADALLVAISELTGVENIITIDSDFHIYRNLSSKKLVNLLSGY